MSVQYVVTHERHAAHGPKNLLVPDRHSHATTGGHHRSTGAVGKRKPPCLASHLLACCKVQHGETLRAENQLPVLVLGSVKTWATRAELQSGAVKLVLGSVKTWATRAELQSGAVKRRRWIP
jgi:hypothetical protein